MKTKFCFYLQPNYPHPRTAIEAEILFAAHIMHLRFLKRPSGKTPREQNSSGKKIGAVWCSGADRRSFEASAVLHFVFFEVMVNKMQQSAKKARNKNNKSSLPEVFPLTAILAGSGKTVPFEKRLLTGAHPCTPVNDEICGIHKSRFCSVSRTSVSVLKLQGDRKKLTAGTVKNVPPCTFLPTCLQSKHATDVNHRRPWRF